MLKLGVGFAVAAIVAALLIPPVLSGALPFVSNSFSFAIGKDLPGDAYFQVCQPVPLNLPDGASVQFTWTLQDPNNGDTTTFGINDSQENVAYSVLTSTHGTGSFTSNGDHYGVCAAWAYNSAGVDLIEFTGSFSVPY